MRRRAVLVAVLAVACAAACTDEQPVKPPEIRLGADTCDACRMTISDLRYAAAAIVAMDSQRQVLKFDDIGCLARWESTALESAPLARWVHDWGTATWIEATTAAFSLDGEMSTPMGSGLAAFADASDAGRFVRERGGESLTWSAVLDRARHGAGNP